MRKDPGWAGTALYKWQDWSEAFFQWASDPHGPLYPHVPTPLSPSRKHIVEERDEGAGLIGNRGYR